jgi:hypothetical protein
MIFLRDVPKMYNQQYQEPKELDRKNGTNGNRTIY